MPTRCRAGIGRVVDGGAGGGGVGAGGTGIMIGGAGGTVLMMGGGDGIGLIGGGFDATCAAAKAMRLLIIWSIPLAATLPAIGRKAKCGART